MFFLKRFPVCFSLCIFFVTPYLVVAVQPCMEWIPFKKILILTINYFTRDFSISCFPVIIEDQLFYKTFCCILIFSCMFCRIITQTSSFLETNRNYVEPQAQRCYWFHQITIQWYQTNYSVHEDSSGEIRTKVKKSELETKGVNEWDLPNDLAKYINTYMTTHKSRKEVSEEWIHSGSTLLWKKKCQLTAGISEN